MHAKIIVPENRRGQSAVVAYGNRIAGIAGGFTASPATGGWIDNDGVLIVEPVTVFDIYIDTPDGPCPRVTRSIDALHALASLVARDRNQDCVYLEIDGKVTLDRP
jgi:hypothetical protein